MFISELNRNAVLAPCSIFKSSNFIIGILIWLSSVYYFGIDYSELGTEVVKRGNAYFWFQFLLKAGIYFWEKRGAGAGGGGLGLVIEVSK
jgi:hypothetical protein